MTDVFLSYSRQNEELMQKIRKDLEKEGILVWTDRTGIERGSPNWQTTIQEAIENARSMIVVLSPAAKQSEWVGREIGYANTFNIPIFPVLTQGNQRTAVPISLMNTDWFDVRQRYSRGIVELIKALRQLLGMSDVKKIPTTSSPHVRKQKIDEIIKAIKPSRRAISGGVVFGRVTLHSGLFAGKNVSYRATISPLTDPDIVEASRILELRGWRIGPLHSNSLTLRRLNKSREAFVYTWPSARSESWFRKRDDGIIRKQVAEEIVAVNELLGVWPEDITVNRRRSS